MMVSERLDGTVAVVTGASSGIGEATARFLADAGASVVVAARRADRLDRLVQAISDDGGEAMAVACDVTDHDQAADLVASTVATHGRLDTLVNNAGVMLLGPVLDAPVAEWERMLAVNVQGLLSCTHAALPHLVAAAETSPRGVADVVHVSSVAGRVVRGGGAVYNLTKHGVVAFSESLRQEVARRHVRVSVVEPGAVVTELSDHLSEPMRAALLERFAEVERLEADDVADAIRYIVTRNRRVAVNELLVRPTEQEG